jgi:hypothetical protein
MSEFKTTTGAGVRRVGWFWPVGLAVSASALSGLIWFGFVVAYAQLTPADPNDPCEGKRAGDQLWSWIAFTISVVLLLTLTLQAVGRLRINRRASILVTAILGLPLALFFALLLLIVNDGSCYGR